MSDELGARARALLQATRFAEDATEADADRVHAAVLARLAAGSTAVAAGAAAAAGAKQGALATASGSATATSAAKAALGALSALSVKVLACAGVVSVVGVSATLGVRAMHAGRPAGREAAERHALAAQERRSPAVQASQGAVAPDVAPPLSSPRAAASSGEQPTTRALAESPPAAAAPPASTAIASSLDGASSLDVEIALLREARQALREGRAAPALGRLDEYARRFPRGVLAEDCDAERVFALCALGKVEQARAEALRFLASHGQSPHADAVRFSCGLGRGHPREDTSRTN